MNKILDVIIFQVTQRFTDQNGSENNKCRILEPQQMVGIGWKYRESSLRSQYHRRRTGHQGE